jgi:hypothetical protein
VSSSTIERLKNRSTGERLHAVFVNSSGNGPVHFELSPHQFTRESGLFGSRNAPVSASSFARISPL